MNFWKDKKVLVTGASGFIGSHLVERLLQYGAQVTGISRQKNPKFLTSVAGQIQLLHGDLNDRFFCQKAMTGQEIIMHLAAQVGGVEYNNSHHASIFINNMRPFNNIIEVAQQKRIERLLVTSSACIYPRDCIVPTPESEGARSAPEQTNAGYGWAKRMQEYLATASMQEFGLSVAIARPYNAYGPRDDFDPMTSHVIPALIKKVMEADKEVILWGDGSSTRSFLYVDDFVSGLIACAEQGVGKGPINIGADEEISIRALLEKIIAISGKNLMIVPDLTKPSGQPRRNCDTSYAKQVLQFSTKISLTEGLRRTIQWYQSQC